MSTSWEEARQILQLYDARLDQLRGIVREFPAEKLAERPLPDMVSLANLVHHVAGSMRDWFENGLAQGDWRRDREAEFRAMIDADQEQLIAHLDATRTHCDAFLSTVNAENWNERREFRGKSWTVREILLRQLEHVAYHTGQAAFLRRLVAGLGPAA